MSDISFPAIVSSLPDSSLVTLDRPECSSFAGTGVYITFTINARKVWVSVNIGSCVCNVYSVNLSLHLWIGLLDFRLGLPRFFVVFSLQELSRPEMRCWICSPVLAQGFFAVLGHLLNQLHCTVSHVLSQNWTVHTTGCAD